MTKIQQTGAATEQTEAATEQTEAATEQTEAATEQTEAATEQTEAATEQTEAATEPKPWDLIFIEHNQLLNDIECISEMVSIVLPVLKNRDRERRQRIQEVSKEVETDKGVAYTVESEQDVQEFIENINKMKRADKMFRQGIIISLVSKFDEYFTHLLKASFHKNPLWLNNPDKKITYKDLLEIESIEKLKDEIIHKEIDFLMRDSHYSQINFLDSKLKLGIIEAFQGWKKFLEINERRNLFVHTGGAVSVQYLENCKKYSIKLEGKIEECVYLSAGDDYIDEAIDCFYELSIRITQAALRRLFPDSFAEADQHLNNSGVELLKEERFGLAQRIFEFSLDIPDQLVGDDEIKYYSLINLCIALKFSGQNFLEKLHSVNWGPFHPKYHFAVAVLEDRFDDAEKLMRNEAVLQELNELAFSDWPLFRDFRKTKQFQNAFKDIYKKAYIEELLDEAEREIKAQQDDSENEVCSA